MTNEEYKKIIQFIENNNKNYNLSRKYITETAENYSFIPADISLEKNKSEPIIKVDAREFQN